MEIECRVFSIKFFPPPDESKFERHFHTITQVPLVLSSQLIILPPIVNAFQQMHRFEHCAEPQKYLSTCNKRNGNILTSSLSA